MINQTTAIHHVTKALMFLILALLMGCVDNSESTQPEKALGWNISSLGESDLPADGGTLSIDINWAYTQWQIKVDEVLEGVDFIQEFTPRVAGSPTLGNTTTRVTIGFRQNLTYTRNVVRLVLQSTDGSGDRLERIISQEAKEFIPLRVNYNPQVVFQHISGFGGGNMMWGSDFLDANELRLAFGTGAGELGLSIYRVRISPVRSEWPQLVQTVREAKKYGATILASPWSPPANLKSNSNLIGGHLLESNYEAYALYLNDFVQFMAQQGASVDIVSMQNEPDIQVSYESCDWTIPQILNFVKNHAHKIQGAKFTASESFNFNQAYTNQLLNDPEALANLDLVSGHIYGSGQAPYPLAEQKGKEVWMTEYLLNQNSGANINNWNRQESVIWEESMEMIQTIHRAMINNWSAYIWWYIRRFYSFLGEGEQGTTRGQTLRRGDAFAQYAKYVRPGYHRIAATLSEQRPIDVTAFQGNGNIVVVLVNREQTSVPAVSIELASGMSTANATVTSLNHRQSPVNISINSTTATIALPPRSITTVVLR